MADDGVTEPAAHGLHQRVRAALSDNYDVLREIASGGMGVVFLAHDRALDRPVAIKVLRPELASATAAERFVREARTLASLRHPNVIPIHHVGEQDGIVYFAMEFLEGQTLAEYLLRQRLPADQAVQFGVQLLDALAAMHQRGIVHRDIKPANVFIQGSRALLGDFGIAKHTADGEDLTGPGALIGTPAYMTPEQRLGGAATPQTDVYSIGALLYEALTGLAWPHEPDPRRANWRGVPSRLARVLAKALEPSPTDRWPDAPSLSRALVRSVRRQRPVGVLLGASAIITIGVVILLAPEADTTGMTTDLAILPFQSSSGESPALGEEIARLAAMHIEGGLPAGRISVTPIAQAFRWWSVSGDTATLALAGAGPALRARRVVTGSVHRVGDSLDVRVRLLDPDGSSRESPVIRGVMASPYDLGYAVGLAIIRLDRPAAATAYQGAPALLGRASEAIRAFIAGEAAFQREMWAAAAAEYRRAIAADSTLAMAWWRLFNVQRWRRIPPDFDLARIVAAYPDAFFPSDMELIEATLAPAGAERLRRFRDAGRRAPLDAYAHLLYANELFHRGPLSGFTRDSAVSVYRTALAADSMLAPAYGGLAWAAIAIGDGPTARDALDRYRRITSPQTDDDFCLGCFLELAWVERFAPDQAAGQRSALLANPAAPGGLDQLSARALRWAPSVGLASVQLDLADLLVHLPDQTPSQRETALVAQALALLGLARPQEAFVRFRTAAAVRQDAALLLQAAQWPVIFAAVTRDTMDVSAALTALQARRDAIGAWTLGVAALLSGRDEEARTWRNQLAAGTLMADVLDALLAHGDAMLRVMQQRLIQEGRTSLPFARSVVHTALGRRLAATHPAAADSVWRWTEAADLDEFPSGPAQAGEVDWAFAPWAARWRADLPPCTGRRC